MKWFCGTKQGEVDASIAQQTEGIEKMERKYNRSLIANARRLRKNMTKEERHLWYDFLLSYPIKFRRQAVLNKYIADFYSPHAKLIIELDGAQHFEDKGIEHDRIRTEFLEQYGLTVIRISNDMINNRFAEVCEYIDSYVKGINL